VDLAHLAGDAVIDARATAPDRQISLAGAELALVAGDPHQLHQVLANLMRNALVHTPAGTPIDVAVEPADGEVAVHVRDHGPGLPPGPSEQLFDRFWRSEGGRERGRAGAGLGLAICKEIIVAHGGRIAAENAAGGGARFTITLPSLPADADGGLPGTSEAGSTVA
jgi:two-component system OmpR family sensor kinase